MRTDEFVNGPFYTCKYNNQKRSLYSESTASGKMPTEYIDTKMPLHLFRMANTESIGLGSCSSKWDN